MRTQHIGSETSLFTARDLVDRTGAKYRNIDHWVREGVIKPVLDARGSGSVRIYDFAALVAVRILLDLREFGVETRVIGETLEWVRACPEVKSLKAAVEALQENRVPHVVFWDGKAVRDWSPKLLMEEGMPRYSLVITFRQIVEKLVLDVLDAEQAARKKHK